MKYFLNCFLFQWLAFVSLVLLINSCGGKVEDGRISSLYAQPPTPTRPPDGHGALNNPNDPNIISPGINILTFRGIKGDPDKVIKQGRTYPVKWLLKPQDNADEGLYTTMIELSKDGGATWQLLASDTDQIPSINDREMLYNWKVPTTEDYQGANFKMRFSTKNAVGAQYTKEADLFSIDDTPPTLVKGTLKVNDQEALTTANINRSFVRVDFEAESANSPVTHYCIITQKSLPKIEEDHDCWKPLSFLGVTEDKKVSVKGAPAFVGFLPGNFPLRLYVKNAGGNISVFTQKKGTDYVELVFSPATPPTVENVVAANTDSPTTPPSRAELSTVSGSEIFIKWAIAPNGNQKELKEGRVKIEYTKDDITYQEIPEVISNTTNGNCTYDNNVHTGCFVWKTGVPAGEYFSVRITAENVEGLATQTSSGGFNSGNFRNVAGNTEIGWGGNAQSAMIRMDSPYASSRTGSLAVTRMGRVYIRNEKGISMIDPSDGLLKLIIKQGTSKDEVTGVIQIGEGVDISKNPEKVTTQAAAISLDYKDRLLIKEPERIRRVEMDTSGNPTTISTIIGLPLAADGKAKGENDDLGETGVPKWYEKDSASQYKYLTAEGCFSLDVPSIPAKYLSFTAPQGHVQMMVPLPNGDILFNMKDYMYKYATQRQKNMSTTDQYGVAESDGVILEEVPYFAIYKELDRRGKILRQVVPLRFCGLGTSTFDPARGLVNQNPYEDLSKYQIASVPGILFNATTSFVESLSFRIFQVTQPVTKDGIARGTTVNPISGKARGANTIYPNTGDMYDITAYLTSRKGNLYNLYRIKGLKKFNPSENKWENVFKEGVGQCVDDTAANECLVDISDAYITEDGVLYFLDGSFRIRVVDETGKVRTLFGQSPTYGEGKLPISARFANIERLGVWGANDMIVAADMGTNYLREIEQGKTIHRILGNNGEAGVTDKGIPVFWDWKYINPNTSGNSPDFVSSLSAETSGAFFQYWGWGIGFSVDRDNGDIYLRDWRLFRDTSNSTNTNYRKAQYFIGSFGGWYGLANKYLGYPGHSSTLAGSSCDGKSAMACIWYTSPSSPAPKWSAYHLFNGGMVTFNNKKHVIVGNHDWSDSGRRSSRGDPLGTHQRPALKLIEVVQTTTAGAHTRATLKDALVRNLMSFDSVYTNRFPVKDSKTEGTSLYKTPYFPSWHYTNLPYRQDDNGKLVGAAYNAARVVRFNVQVTATPAVTDGAQTLEELFATQKGIRSFNTRTEKGIDVLYYCGNDGNLRKVVDGVGAGLDVETTISLPLGFTCSGNSKSIEWNKAKDAFFFVYVRNGLNGIGEYYVGPAN